MRRDASPRYTDGSWLYVARCRGEDPGRFFPTDSRRASTDIDAALALCRECEVTEQCLELNLSLFSARDDSGVWGGTTVSQRLQIRKARRRRGR